MTSTAPSGSQSELRTLLRAQLPVLRSVAGLSVVIGALVLVPTWYMLEVYDRVVNSRSLTTLAMLLVLVLGVYLVMELLELARASVLRRVGEQVDRQLRRRLFDAVFQANLRRVPGGTVQVFTDLRTLRDFFGSPAVVAALDAPVALLFLVLVSLISPWLGVLTLLGALVQLMIAISTERRTLPALTDANRAAIEAQNFAGGALRSAQVVESMGMLGAIHRRWHRRQQRLLARQAEASDVAGLNAAVARMLQQMLGSLVLGASCWLILNGDMRGGGGMMIVASVLGGRVLAPLAQAVAQWRVVVNVRDAYARLDGLLRAVPPVKSGMALPAPRGVLSVEAVVAAAPGSTVPILRGVSFAARPGELLAIVGPSAAGKTTLARLLVGVWSASSGQVRLDGADIAAWNKAELGPHVGYLPQAVELFDGTIAENIARFGPLDRDRVREAMRQVGMLEWVDSLPEREDTRIGEDGAVLSGGQRQRVGLARAVFGDPALLVLDEPNASLDEAGDQDLLRLLAQCRQRGATVVVITHRTSVMPVSDKLLVLVDGQVARFGPRDEVLAALRKAAGDAPSAARSAPGGLRAQPAGETP